MKYSIAAAAFAVLAAAAPVEQRGTDAPYGDKKGLAYNNNAAIQALSKAGSATWAYNWGVSSPKNAFQYIPMCWDKNCDANGLMASVKAGAPWVLGFNEPDMCGNGGSCTSPKATADSWGPAMSRYTAAGAKVVCPAITSNDTPNGPGGFASGLTWLEQFVGGNAAGLKCSAQALHWYGDASKNGHDQGQLFINYIKSASARVNKIFGHNMDLWITEFAPLPIKNPDVMSDFLAVVIPFLDGADYVSRYSPFQAEDLLTNGAPNKAGNTFITAH